MFKPQLTVHQWLSIDHSIRQKLVELFGIPKTGNSVVTTYGIESDGYTPKDLQAITLEKLQDYLKSTEQDFFKLVEQVIASLKDASNEETSSQTHDREQSGELESGDESGNDSADESVDSEPVPAKRGRKTKSN